MLTHSGRAPGRGRLSLFPRSAATAPYGAQPGAAGMTWATDARPSLNLDHLISKRRLLTVLTSRGCVGTKADNEETRRGDSMLAAWPSPSRRISWFAPHFTHGPRSPLKPHCHSRSTDKEAREEAEPRGSRGSSAEVTQMGNWSQIFPLGLSLCWVWMPGTPSHHCPPALVAAAWAPPRTQSWALAGLRTKLGAWAGVTGRQRPEGGG